MSICLAEMINNKLTYYLLERKAVCKPATMRREETNAGTTQMTALVKGSTCSYGRSSTRFFSKIASIFKKVLHLKHLNCHLECILM